MRSECPNSRESPICNCTPNFESLPAPFVHSPSIAANGLETGKSRKRSGGSTQVSRFRTFRKGLFWAVLIAEASAVRRARAIVPDRHLACTGTTEVLSALKARLSSWTKKLRLLTSLQTDAMNPSDDSWRLFFESSASACGSPAMALTAVQQAFLPGDA